MGSTTNHNIYFLSNGDPQSQITESATQAGTIETALDSVSGDIESVNNFGVQYFANASARDLALVSPTVGWLTQLDSELFMRRWNGSAWIPFGAKEFPIKPASVSGNNVTVDGNGIVSWTNSGGVLGDAYWVTLDGVFSDEFRRFQLEWTVSGFSAGGTAIYRLRSGGVPYTAASGYANVNIVSSGTSSSTVSVTTSYALLTPTSYNSTGTGRMELTNMRSSSGDKLIRTDGAIPQSGSFSQYSGSAHCITTSPVDGIMCKPSGDATTWSGSLRVYGVL